MAENIPFPEYMQILANAAVEAAAAAKVNLDYSEDSIQRLEEFIELHEEHLEPEEETAKNAKYWGAYIGEVFRRNVGGEWLQWEDEYGKAAAIECNGTKIFPIDKVNKRIFQGKENHLPSSYATFKALMLEHPPE